MWWNFHWVFPSSSAASLSRASFFARNVTGENCVSANWELDIFAFFTTFCRECTAFPLRRALLHLCPIPKVCNLQAPRNRARSGSHRSDTTSLNRKDSCNVPARFRTARRMRSGAHSWRWPQRIPLHQFFRFADCARVPLRPKRFLWGVSILVGIQLLVS